MLPINIREMKRMLKRYGVEVQELPEVKEVRLSAEGYDMIIKDPQVAVLSVGQQKIVQIMCSKIEKVEKTREQIAGFSEEDIQFVMEQTGASREEALSALRESGGDIAKAILKLQEGRGKASRSASQ